MDVVSNGSNFNYPSTGEDNEESDHFSATPLALPSMTRAFKTGTRFQLCTQISVFSVNIISMHVMQVL